MLFYTTGQSIAFLLMVTSGLVIGLIYDGFLLMRRLFKPGFLLTLFLDLLFGAAAAGVIILFLWRALEGELRLYAFMGTLCGLILYGFSLAPLLRASCGGLSCGCRWAAARLRKSRLIQKLLK